MSTITSGTELRHIQNRAYCRYDTANAEKIVHALDKGNVPHFARYNQQALSLTYDSSFQAVVDEIMIDCQVKCNTIREKNFEAPRRESEN